MSSVALHYFCERAKTGRTTIKPRTSSPVGPKAKPPHGPPRPHWHPHSEQENHAALTVVMPAYNEQAGIKQAVDEIREGVLDRVPGATLIVVNDGSRDATGPILNRLADSDDRINVVHQPNAGHGPAVWRGLEQATGEFVLLVDSDRQIPLAALASFLEYPFDDRGLHRIHPDRPLAAISEHYDAVLGVRVRRHDPLHRLLLTRLVRLAVRLLFGIRLRDANVPFKLLRRTAWLEARGVIPSDTLTPSLFLAVFLTRKGFKVSEREVPHRERQTGEVSIRRWKLLKFCARAFGQLIAFRRELIRCQPRPKS